MKKLLLAILVLSLVVSCFALTLTATAAEQPAAASVADTLDRGYIQYKGSYYNVTWNVDYGKLASPWGTQPIAPNSGGSVAYDYFGSGVAALKIEASADGQGDPGNYRIGGISNDPAYPDNKLSKNPVKTYFQFDVDVEGFSMVNIWTNGGEGLWTEMKFNGTTWEPFGAKTDIDDLEVISSPLGKGLRVSYWISIPAAVPNIPFYINVGGSGAVYFANFVVAEIDTNPAPWVSSATVTYDVNNNADVQVNLDTKGQAITEVTCDEIELDAGHYSYDAATETLTLKAAAFTDKTDDVEFVVTTNGGSAEFTVTAIEGLKTVSATVVTGPINKYFDNTTDVKEAIEIQLSGIDPEHDVGVSYTAEYDSAEVGTGRIITVHLTLTGDDRTLYQLDEDTKEIEGCEIYALTPVTPSYTGGTIEKYDDGTTAVPQGTFELTLTGVDEDDDVRATFTANFAAVVGENIDVNVTNITLVGTDAYKYTLTQESLTIEGKGNIIARTRLEPKFLGEYEKRYDGTTYINKAAIELTLVGDIAEGDQVYATFNVEFISALAGTRTIKFTNIALAGAQAYKYVLAGDGEIESSSGYILAVENVEISDDLGYYTMDGGLILAQHNFENQTVSDNPLVENAISGMYFKCVNPNELTYAARIVDDNGNKALQMKGSTYGYMTNFFNVDGLSAYRDAGTYAVAFKIKPVDTSVFGVAVRKVDNNEASGIITEFKCNVQYQDGKASGVTENTNLGFIGGEHRYFNDYVKVLEDGWLDCYFEFIVTAEDEFLGACPIIMFQGVSSAGGTDQEVTILFDDIAFIKRDGANKYMTIDHDYDFNDGTVGTAVTNTPFYSNFGSGFVYDEFMGESVIKLDIPANTANTTRVGAFKNDSNAGDNKLFLGKGIHYVQFDFYMECSYFNLFSIATDVPFNYFEIECNMSISGLEFNVKPAQGGCISNFQAVQLPNFMTRVSFVANMTGSDYYGTELILQAGAGADSGAIYFDNLFVSHEDYTPLASDTTYNYIAEENEKVSFPVDLKGGYIKRLELNGEEVNLANYEYEYGKDKILVDRSLFDASEGTHTLTIITNEGQVTAKATLIDNRQAVTFEVNYNEEIVKDYDGNTDIEKDIQDAIAATITMIGVSEADQADVDYEYEIAYSQKDAGEVQVVITFALTGDKADNYKLGTETLTLPATINKIQLTVSAKATVAAKTYDGTTSANVTAGALVGVLEGENVTLVATGTFNSKNVSEANKVTVTYTLTGEDVANYIAPVDEEIAATIGKKTITVTAENKSMVVGGTEPALTYTASGLVAGDTLTGALTRESGTEVGTYAILQGTLADSSGNYTINFVAGTLTITEAPVEQPGTEPGDDDGLSAGAIAGIAVGSTAVAGGGAALAIVLIRRRRRM